MVLFGVFLILAGLLGAYVSNSSQLTVLIFYEIFSAVIMSFLLLWAAFCFYQMSLVDDSVDKHWDRLGDESAGNDEERTPEEEEERKDAAASVFKSWLLVTGVLETVLAFFQLVNFLAAHALFQVIAHFNFLRKNNGYFFSRIFLSCRLSLAYFFFQLWFRSLTAFAAPLMIFIGPSTKAWCNGFEPMASS